MATWRNAAIALAVLAAPGSASAQLGAPDLALSYRPALYFHPDERWRPVEVERFLGERRADGARHRRCRARCEPVAGAASLSAAWTYLDLIGSHRDGADAASPALEQCGRPRGLRDCDRGPWSAIYANVSERNGLVYVDYWWYLRYNESLPDHEGDWEGVTVALRPALLGHEIDHVTFAAHGRRERYAAGVATFEGTHVRVYVARGSHASYPRPCARRCRQTGGRRLPERSFGGGAPWPANADANCALTCVMLLPERDPDPEVITTANAASWNGWPGRWGDRARRTRLQSAGPRSPGHQARYRAPWRSRRYDRRAF